MVEDTSTSRQQLVAVANSGTAERILTIDRPSITLFCVTVFQGVLDESPEVRRRWLLCPAIVA